MTLSRLPRSILEVYGAHVVLNVACGVPMEDLYVVPALAADGSGECVGVLARQGAFEFVLTCGPFGMSRSAFKRAWRGAATIIKVASAKDRAAAIDKTWARQHAVQIIAAYQAKRRMHEQ